MAISPDDAIDVLQTLPLLCDLTPHQLQTVAKLVTFETRDEDEVVMRTAGAAGLVYFILTGYVKICIPRDNDIDLILCLRGAGAVLGEMSVVDEQEKSATVLTHTPCEVASLSREDFWNVLWNFPPVPYNLAHLLSGRIRQLNGNLTALVPCDSETRLARQLLLLTREFGKETPYDDLVTLPFPLSPTDLAGLTAMPHAEIAELLRDWRDEGIIGSASDAEAPFVVRDSAALQTIAAQA